MANQRPFDDYLTRPLELPRNPAGEAGMGGPMSGIMHAATQFVTGAREARARQMVESERQQAKNTQAIATMLEQLDKGGYDPDDPDVHQMRGQLMQQLAMQVAGTDDGTKPGQPGANPMGSMLKQMAVNLLGGQAPKKAAPITPEQIQMWQGGISQLPTLATAQQRAREGWVSAIQQAKTEAEAQAKESGVPVGAEFYQNHPKLVEAGLAMQRYGLKPTELGGAHPSVIGRAEEGKEFQGSINQFNQAIQTQRDSATVQDAATSASPEGNLLAQFLAKQNPAAMQPPQPFNLPASMGRTIPDKSNYLGPNGERKEVYTHPGNITIDSQTRQPVDTAAMTQQGYKLVSQFPAEHVGKRTGWVERPGQNGVMVWSVVDMATGKSKPIMDEKTGQEQTKTITEGKYYPSVNQITGEMTYDWRPDVQTQVGGSSAPPAQRPSAPPVPPVTQPAAAAPTQPPAPPSPPGAMKQATAQPVKQLDGTPNSYRQMAAQPPAQQQQAATQAADPEMGAPLPVMDPNKRVAKGGVFLGQVDANELFEWGKSIDDLKDTYPGDKITKVMEQYMRHRPLAVYPQKEQVAKMDGFRMAALTFSRFKQLSDKYKRGEIIDGGAAALRAVNEGSLPQIRGFMTDKGAFSEGDRAAYRRLTPELMAEWISNGRNDELVKLLFEGVGRGVNSTLGTNMKPGQRKAIMSRYQIDQLLGSDGTTNKFAVAKFNAPK